MNDKKKKYSPSLSSGIFGVIAAIFGIVWTFIVWKMKLKFLIPTGLLIIVISAGNAVFNLSHLSGNNKFTSYDIKDENKLDKSWEEIIHHDAEDYDQLNGTIHNVEEHQYILCPYCNRKIVSDALYCSYCGREIRK